MKGNIKEIDYKSAVDFLLPRHYAGRIPTISRAFGWFESGGRLVAVCTFGKPASPFLCRGICGEQHAHSVYELNRLCRVEDWTEPLSQFVSACLRRLRTENWIIVSFSDTAMNHHGYIYQACNFIYTGCTKERTDRYAPNGKHPRHTKLSDQGEFRKVRSAKHRYVYFCTRNKRLKQAWLEALNYPPMPYPKGDNSDDYVLGKYLQEKVVRINQ